MAKRKMNALDWIAIILLIIGGINWLLTTFGFNLVTMLLPTMMLQNIIYWLVGLSAIYSIFTLTKLNRR